MQKNSQKGNALVGFLVIGVIMWGVFSLFSEDATDEQEFNATDYNSPTISESEIPPDNSYISTRNYDDTYQYNYRTGVSGDYEYNYDVDGYGDDGYVYGTVDTSGKYGEGYIYDEDGDELWVETEWTDYGVLEAYDEEGNWYELEAE